MSHSYVAVETHHNIFFDVKVPVEENLMEVSETQTDGNVAENKIVDKINRDESNSNFSLDGKCCDIEICGDPSNEQIKMSSDSELTLESANQSDAIPFSNMEVDISSPHIKNEIKDVVSIEGNDNYKNIPDPGKTFGEAGSCCNMNIDDSYHHTDNNDYDGKVNKGVLIINDNCCNECGVDKNQDDCDDQEADKKLLELMKFLQVPTSSSDLNRFAHQSKHDKESNSAESTNCVVRNDVAINDADSSLDGDSAKKACTEPFKLGEFDSTSSNSNVCLSHSVVASVEDFSHKDAPIGNPDEYSYKTSVSLLTSACSVPNKEEVATNYSLSSANLETHETKEVADFVVRNLILSDAEAGRSNERNNVQKNDATNEYRLSTTINNPLSQNDIGSSVLTSGDQTFVPILMKQKSCRRRPGLENILQRRLLMGAKPVNHSVVSEECFENLDISAGSNVISRISNPTDDAMMLRLNDSVQVLTDQPESITVLEGSDSSKETLWTDASSITDFDSCSARQDYFDQRCEGPFKRLNKRKCSSPQRIIKKIPRKNESLSSINSSSEVISKNVFSWSQTTSDSSTASGSINSVTASSITSVCLGVSSSSHGAAVGTTQHLSNHISNIITIAPDDSYLEPLKAKSTPLTLITSSRSFRAIAPKSLPAAVVQSKLISHTASSCSVTPSIIPISLMPSTTTSSLVILVNGNGRKQPRLISAQQFQLQRQLNEHHLLLQKQIQQQLQQNQKAGNQMVNLPLTFFPKNPIIINSISKPCNPIPSQHQFSTINSTTVLPSSSTFTLTTPPKLKPLVTNQHSNALNTHAAFVPFTRQPLESLSNVISFCEYQDLKKLFEPCLKSCLIGKFVTTPQSASKLGLYNSGTHSCSSCGSSFPSKVALDYHINRKSFLVRFVCSCSKNDSCLTSYNFCAHSNAYREHLLKHPYTSHSSSDSYTVSLLPDELFLPENYYLKQLVSLDNDKQLDQRSLVLNKNEEDIVTTAVMEEDTELNNEAKGRNICKLQCSECQKMFRLPQKLKQHFQGLRLEQTRSKSSLKLVSAKDNNQSLATSSPGASLSNIAASPTAATAYQECRICKIVFGNSCSLKAHLRMHYQGPPYVCPECGVTFLSPNVLSLHLTKVCFHNCRQNIIKGCRFCSYIPINLNDRSSSSSFGVALDAHITSSHKRSYLKCSYCPVAFSEMKILQKHCQMMHSDNIIKALTVTRCPVCESVLSVPFEKHIASHDVDSKSKKYYFRCSKCSDCFVFRVELEKHMRRSGHDDSEKSGFVCKLCLLTFESRIKRAEHIITEHKGLTEMFADELSILKDSTELNKSVNDDNKKNKLLENSDHVLDQDSVKSSVNNSLPPLKPIITSGTVPLSSDSKVNSVESHSIVSSGDKINITSVGKCLLNAGEESCAVSNVSVSTASSCELTSKTSKLSMLLTAPERECSRCNEVFSNNSAFVRHHQKHRFLEERKSKKRKFSAVSGAFEALSGKDSSITKSQQQISEVGTSTNSILSLAQTCSVGSQDEIVFTSAAIETVMADAPSSSSNSSVQIQMKLEDNDTMSEDNNRLSTLLRQECHSESETSSAGTWHSCQLCCMSFRSLEQLLRHTDTNHVGIKLVKPVALNCLYCSPSEGGKKIFASIRHLLKHLRIRHKIIRNKAGQYVSLDAPYKPGRNVCGPMQTEKSNEENDNEIGSNYCTLAPPVSANDLISSQSNETSSVTEDNSTDIRTRRIFGAADCPYNCSYCDQSNFEKNIFWEHIISCHFDSRQGIDTCRSSSQCPECGSIFVVNATLFRHLKLVHGVHEENEYEEELSLFESFKKELEAKQCKPSVHCNEPENIHPTVISKNFNPDLPPEKLAKLASLRTEDIHAGLVSSSRTSYLFDQSSSDQANMAKRPGLRSQPRVSTDLPSNMPASGDSHDPLSSNECNVCYKIFDNQLDLRVHMRVHGMAFIQGTKRNSSAAIQNMTGNTPDHKTVTV